MAEIFLPMANPSLSALTWMVTPISTSITWFPAKTTELPLPKGVNSFGGQNRLSLMTARLLYYHNGANAPGDAWTYDLHRQIDPGHAFADGGRSCRSHG